MTVSLELRFVNFFLSIIIIEICSTTIKAMVSVMISRNLEIIIMIKLKMDG
jgi:hypothetical protein